MSLVEDHFVTEYLLNIANPAIDQPYQWIEKIDYLQTELNLQPEGIQIPDVSAFMRDRRFQNG